jgi:hypothetical protein
VRTLVFVLTKLSVSGTKTHTGHHHPLFSLFYACQSRPESSLSLGCRCGCGGGAMNWRLAGSNGSLGDLFRSSTMAKQRARVAAHQRLARPGPHHDHSRFQSSSPLSIRYNQHFGKFRRLSDVSVICVPFQDYSKLRTPPNSTTVGGNHNANQMSSSCKRQHLDQHNIPAPLRVIMPTASLRFTDSMKRFAIAFSSGCPLQYLRAGRWR